MDTGILIIRIILGLTLAAHGAQKLSRLFGGHGISGTGAVFASLGFRHGKLFALLAGLGEAGGGLALTLGLLTPFASSVVLATMLVALWAVHLSKGFFAENGGYEYALILGTAAVGLAFTGPGTYSLDDALGLPLAGVTWGLIALGLGVAGALLSLVSRTPAKYQVSKAS